MDIPAELTATRVATLKAIQPIRPLSENASATSHFLLEAQRTEAGENLPPYYLVYFLLVDLLGFGNLGESEKIAWSVPIDFKGKTFLVEHRKFGIGVFSQDAKAEEPQAEQIVALIKEGVRVAEPFFEWLAEQAVQKSELNVPNKSHLLLSRFEYFLNLYHATVNEAEKSVVEKNVTSGSRVKAYNNSNELKRNARWLALATIDVFFSWTEHVFIHLAILSGKAISGIEVSNLTEADWPDKFKKSLNISEPQIKIFYDALLLIRRQLRNFVAHGAFGKRGETFSFHSGAGAVPILLPHQVDQRRFTLTDTLAFEDEAAIETIEKFIQFLWSGDREPARLYIQKSGLPLILTMAKDGTYDKAMRSAKEMEELITYLSCESDRASNMDF